MIKKYLVLGGFVRSKTDNQEHYLPAISLVYLYKVKPEECVLSNLLKGQTESERDLTGIDVSGLIQLRPDYHGEYKLPEK